MKLSEAIRAGAKIRPQAHSNLYGEKSTLRWWHRLFRQRPEITKTSCALGAAFEAVGCESHDEPVPKGTRGLRGEAGDEGIQTIFHQPIEWNTVLVGVVECPQCQLTDEGRYLIPHLNDDHKWTREEIALWVERLENTTPVVVAPPVVVIDPVLEASEIG